MRLSAALAEKGSYNDAISAAEKATRMRFCSAYGLGFTFDSVGVGTVRGDGLANIAIKYAKEGKVDIAINKFRECLTSEPKDDDASAFYNLGVIYLQLKAFDKAATAFESAVSFSEKEVSSSDWELRRFALAGWAVAKSKADEAKAAQEILKKFAGKVP